MTPASAHSHTSMAFFMHTRHAHAGNRPELGWSYRLSQTDVVSCTHFRIARTRKTILMYSSSIVYFVWLLAVSAVVAFADDTGTTSISWMLLTQYTVCQTFSVFYILSFFSRTVSLRSLSLSSLLSSSFSIVLHIFSFISVFNWWERIRVRR